MESTAPSSWAANPGSPSRKASAATPIIKKIINQMDSEDGWVTLGEVGKQLANLASDFDPRNYGFRKLSDLVRKTDAVDIEEQKGGAVRIRRKVAAKASPSRSKAAAKTAT